MFGWHLYDSDIWPKQCYVGISITVSFGRQTFGQNNVWMQSLKPWHLVIRHLAKIMCGWHFYWPRQFINRHLAKAVFSCHLHYHDILPKQCLDAISKTLSFGRQTFGPNNVWMPSLWPWHLVITHLAKTMCSWYVYWPWHLAKRMVICHLNEQTFGRHDVWLILLWPLIGWHVSFRTDDTQHNDIQHNDIQHNDIQHNDIQHCGTQHKDTHHIETQHTYKSNTTLSTMNLNKTTVSITKNNSAHP